MFGSDGPGGGSGGPGGGSTASSTTASSATASSATASCPFKAPLPPGGVKQPRDHLLIYKLDLLDPIFGVPEL